MRHLKIGAFFKTYAGLIRAYSAFELLCTGGVAEIRGRSADVVDIAFEILVRDEFFRFFDKAFFAPFLNYPALMVSQRAVIT